MKAIKIVKGVPEVVTMEPERTYEAIRDAVEGYIERFAVYVRGNGRTVDFWCNEEFLLHDQFEPNVGILFPYPNIIYGNVFITAGNDEGETIGLTDEEISLVQLIGREGFPLKILLFDGVQDPAEPIIVPANWVVIEGIKAPPIEEQLRKIRESMNE